MRRYALAALALVLLVFLAVAGLHSAPALSTKNPSVREIGRIQGHLAGAERVLERRDLSALTLVQRQARVVQAERLREYRLRGVFPHNHHFRIRRPFFVDDHGVLCAMAYLISESGRDDIVRLVQRTRNNATVLELAADAVIGPILSAWLDEAGLTVSEAQRIQPEYEPTPFNDVDLSGKEEMPSEVVAASAALGALNVATSYLNLESGASDLSPSWARYVGVVGGLAGIGLGGTLLVYNDHQDATMLGVMSLFAGTMATISGISSISKAKKASAIASLHSDTRHVSISPAFHGGMAPGVGVRLRF
jgi:hypothetical protein